MTLAVPEVSSDPRISTPSRGSSVTATSLILESGSALSHLTKRAWEGLDYRTTKIASSISEKGFVGACTGSGIGLTGYYLASEAIQRLPHASFSNMPEQSGIALAGATMALTGAKTLIELAANTRWPSLSQRFRTMAAIGILAVLPQVANLAEGTVKADDSSLSDTHIELFVPYDQTSSAVDIVIPPTEALFPPGPIEAYTWPGSTSFPSRTFTPDQYERAGQWYPVIKAYTEIHGLHTPGWDPNALILAIILVESGADADAYSSAGAVGLMQVMPNDAPGYGGMFSDRPSTADLWSESANIDAGVAILNGKIFYWGSIEDGIRSYYGDMNDDSYLSMVRGVHDWIFTAASQDN